MTLNIVTGYLCQIFHPSFPFYDFLTRLTRRMSPVEQILLTLPGHLSSLRFLVVLVTFVFCVVSYWQLFVCVSFFCLLIMEVFFLILFWLILVLFRNNKIIRMSRNYPLSREIIWLYYRLPFSYHC
jgi:small-conductance mechanosensitive channel